MAEIKLTKGLYAIVDDEDFEMLNQYKWHSNVGYAARTIKANPKKTVLMHRFIINAPKGTCVDHINTNKLDNRKANLRLADKSKNSMNRVVSNYSTTGFKGVHFYKAYKKYKKPYQAYITANKKRINLGYFETAVDAAKAYNEAALIYHGEFARLNDV